MTRVLQGRWQEYAVEQLFCGGVFFLEEKEQRGIRWGRKPIVATSIVGADGQREEPRSPQKTFFGGEPPADTKQTRKETDTLCVFVHV